MLSYYVKTTIEFYVKIVDRSLTMQHLELDLEKTHHLVMPVSRKRKNNIL